MACLFTSCPAVQASDWFDIGPDEDPVKYAKRVIGAIDRKGAQLDEARKSGNLGKQIRIFKEMVEIERKVLGDDHTDVAGGLLNLADLHAQLGQVSRARDLLLEALAIVEQQPFSLWEEATIRFYMEEFERRQQMTPGERVLLEECSSIDQIRKKLEEKGKWDQAVPLAEETLRIRKELLGDNRPGYAMDLLELGLLVCQAGDIGRAESILQESLAVTRRTLGECHHRYSWGLFSLGHLYYLMEDYERAEPFLLEAFALYERTGGKDDNNYMRIASLLGELFARRYDLRTAFGFERIKASSELSKITQRDLIAPLLSRLAGSLCRQGELGRAEKALLKSLKAGDEAFGRNHPRYAQLQQKAAQTYCEMGEFDRAESHFLQALETFRHHLMLSSPSQPEWQQISLANRIRGSLDSYLSFASTAALSGGKTYLWVLPWKGSAFLYQRHMRALRDDPDLKSLFDDLRDVSNLLGACAFTEAEPEKQDLRRKRINELSGRLAEIEKELSSRMSSYRNFDPVNNPGTAVLASRIDFASICFRAPAPARSGSGSGAGVDDAAPEVRSFQEEISRELASRSAAYRQASSSLLQGPGGTPCGLPPKAVLVDFLEYTRTLYGQTTSGKEIPQERHLAAFVLRNETPVEFVDLGPVEPIRLAVESWRRKMCGEKRESTTDRGKTLSEKASAQDIDWTRDRTALRLRQLLWEPLKESVAGAGLVLISPDSCLGLLPIAALPGSRPGTYLVEEVAMARIPTPQLLPGIMSAEPADDTGSLPSLFLVGGVDFDAELPEKHVSPDSKVAMRGSLEEWKAFPTLTHTGSEIVHVKDQFARLFPGAAITALSGRAAAEGVFREEAGRHRFIHLATHGFFAPPEVKEALDLLKRDPKRPLNPSNSGGLSTCHPGLLSGIVFAGANRQQPQGRDDGIFTAVEMAASDLSGVELMVLSACETGLGVSTGGEGYIGLLRAAQLAGARTVVASLWKVNDEATRELMGRFYENLWSGRLPKLEALRQVQLEMIARKAPPKHWAAWVLSGDWR